MYSLADAISVKADWGHSSNIVGVELCQLAGARQLCLFHHEPAHDDDAIARMLAETRRLEEITRTGEPLRVTAAYDGMEIDVVSDRAAPEPRPLADGAASAWPASAIARGARAR